jgi:ATP-dependent DNA ligase
MAKAEARRPADWHQQIAPMLAEIAESAFDSPAHLFEIKWDGIRCLARVEPQGMTLHNRRLGDISARYPELHGLAAAPPYTIIDGEIVVLEDGRPSFTKVMQRHHVTEPRRVALLQRSLPVTLMAFDVLYCAGENLMARPLCERRQKLQELAGGLADPHVVATDCVLEQGLAYFAAAEKFGLEGIMAKRLDSPYLPNKRSGHWLKIKVARIGEFDIIGFTARSPAGPISALLLGTAHRGRLIFKGRVGSGFTEEQRQALFDALSRFPALDAPPAGGPADGVWCRTGLKARVRFLEKTANGMLRGPVFLELTD